MAAGQPMPTTWDPLSPDASLAGEIYAATLKREIRNIIKSYTGWFDPLSELMQNSLDAVDQRAEQEEGYHPRVWIEVDLKGNSISVTDNGIGFKREEFLTFLRPSVSFKKPGRRGDKGVGATYLAYGFNFLQIGTRTQDFSWVGNLEAGREWVDDDKGIVIRPTLKPAPAIHYAYDEIDRGSTFCLRFMGKNIRPSNLAWFGATTAEQWEILLRVKTPLGGIYQDRPVPKTTCCLRVIHEDGTRETREISQCTYLYPHLVIPTCANLKEMVEKQHEIVNKGKGDPRLPERYYGLNGIYSFWDYKELIEGKGSLRHRLDKDELELIEKYRPSMYGFFTFSTDVWDEYNDSIAKLRKGERVLRGGLQMAANGMPQGPLLLIPLTSNIGYQHTSHVIIHLDYADPDLGRKGFQPELETLAKELSTSIVGSLLNWRTHVKASTGSRRQILEDKEIHDWKRETENHEERAPIVITRQDVFLPTKQISLTATPVVEQDVVVLFNQLLAGGVIRGIKLMAASQFKRYDGLWRAYVKEPFSNYVFDKERNPLGLEKIGTGEYVSAPYVLEYKYSFDALLEEIEQGEKDESSINLVVCWEMGERWRQRYRVTSLLDLSNVHHRDIHGITHFMKDEFGQFRFWVVVLSELLDYINNPDSIQQRQSEEYAE